MPGKPEEKAGKGEDSRRRAFPAAQQREPVKPADTTRPAQNIPAVTPGVPPNNIGVGSPQPQPQNYGQGQGRGQGKGKVQGQIQDFVLGPDGQPLLGPDGKPIPLEEGHQRPER
jgi:hypothetical protein